MVKIILIGRCCRIVKDTININLKQKTSLFDWTWTNTLHEINIIIKKIINNIPIKTIRKDGNDFLEDTNIFTSHYIDKKYNEIVDRRAKRFLNDILKNKEILFIRDDVLNTIKQEEIDCFYSLIKIMNSNLYFKVLLLSEKDNFKEIICNNLHHKIYNPSLYKEYINECFNTDNNYNNIDITCISDDEK